MIVKELLHMRQLFMTNLQHLWQRCCRFFIDNFFSACYLFYGMSYIRLTKHENNVER